MSFLSQRRLFIIPLNLRQWQGYFLDFVFLLFLWVVWLSAPSLLKFGREPVVVLFPHTVSLFAGLSAGFIRLAILVAILRQNRFPQRLEWILTLLGGGWLFLFAFFGGPLLGLWASVHDYRRCPVEGVRDEPAIFAKVDVPCLPPGGQPSWT